MKHPEIILRAPGANPEGLPGQLPRYSLKIELLGVS
jgi:hypothetical protein